MYKFLIILSFGLVASLAQAHSRSYEVDTSNSMVSLATIKKEYIVEPATLSDVTGSLSASGEVKIKIGLKSIDTGISIRNDRLNKLFFKSLTHPNIDISAKISKLKKGVQTMTIPIDISWYGTTKKYEVLVLATKSRRHITVSSMKPIVINSQDFKLPASNLINLAKTVGAIPISGIVPVSFALTFKRNK